MRIERDAVGTGERREGVAVLGGEDGWSAVRAIDVEPETVPLRNIGEGIEVVDTPTGPTWRRTP